MVRRKGVVSVGMYLPPESAARLRQLSELTRVSQAAYFREAIDDLLEKYAEVLEQKKTTKAKKTHD